MEEFGTDSGVLLKASETGLSEWGQWVRHVFLEGIFIRCMLHWKLEVEAFSETALGRFWVQYVVMMSDELLSGTGSERNRNTFSPKKKEKTQKVPGRIYMP